ncbi:MAG TPA: butyrate kinase [Clostridia bacterium]|nr:butyrate kinase [Clostridia bacterium]
MVEYNILVINPGSTSTQVGIFQNERCVVERSLSHSLKELSLDVDDQRGFREKAIKEFISDSGFSVEEFHGIAARGGRLKPLSSGTYLLNDEMLEDSYDKTDGNHASRLAVIIGEQMAKVANCPLYIVDPISVDEMIDEARISGMPDIERRSLSHALNLKAVGRKTAQDLNKSYDELNMIIAHLGGGTTISGHMKGRMFDVINDFEGIFTPERAGGLPNLQLIKLCFSGKYTEKEIIRKAEGQGGFFGYLGTKDFLEIEDRIAQGDERAKKIMDAYLYQMTKVIGSMAAVLKYDVDVISITGSIARSKRVIDHLEEAFSAIAPIKVYPGSFELEALAMGVLRVLTGKEKAKSYPSGDVIL